MLLGQAALQGEIFSLNSGLKNFHEPVKFTSVVVIEIGSFSIS